MAGGFKYQPQGVQAIAAEFRDIRNELAAVRRALTGLGLQIDPNGNLIFDGSQGNLDIIGGGNLNVSGNETVSGTLNVTGNTVIGGTLSLPNGIINNAALASPVSPATMHGDGTNFSLLHNVYKAVATASVAVPTGFTRALIFATATASAANSTASTDALFVDPQINSIATPGWAPGVQVAAGAFGTTTGATCQLLTGLSGGSIVATAQALANNAAWAANGNNIANIDAIVLFLR